MFGIGKKKEIRKEVVGSYISGLDFPENVVVLVTLTGEKVMINAPSLKKEYSINLERVLNISEYNETEIETVMKSSLAKGLIGASAFGLVGAIVGSQPTAKQKKKVHSFLLIEYADGQITIASEAPWTITALVKQFRELKPNVQQRIEL